MWKLAKIGDVCDIRRGASPRPIQNFLSDKGMPWVKIADATADSSRYITETKECIIPEGISKSLEVHPDDLIVSNSATPGLPKIMKIDACIHDGWLLLSNFRDVTRDFLYYKFIDIRSHLVNQANGSVFQNLKTDIVRDFDIQIPSIAEQNRIVKILHSLDDKIELNNQINRNLEEQAQAIFKSRFIDFEPFGGEMPKDWINGKLSDLGTVVGGGTPSKAKNEYYTHNGIAWITPKDLSLHPNKFTSKGEIDITQEGYANSSAKIMPEGTILFSSRAPIGYITIAKNEVCTNQGFKSVIPKANIGTAYIYFYLKTHTEEIENKASGSTFKEASGSLMNSLDAIIPSDNILSDFNKICNPIFNQQKALEDENQHLINCRDMLLPKLMSGEINLGC